jgi:hypothetical protein
MTRITGTLHEVSTFMTISLRIILRMRNVSHKSRRKNQNTYFVFSNFFFFLKSCLYEILSRNVVEPERLQMRVWRMRIACWISKATRAEVHAHACDP